jgi:NADPH2:quinone reductase
MRAVRAEKFSGYEGLKPADLPKPAVSGGKVLLRVTAAGVTPLDHTILSGHFPLAKAPLVLGNEGAGVVEEGAGTDFPIGSRVMFTGPYGVLKMEHTSPKCMRAGPMGIGPPWRGASLRRD